MDEVEDKQELEKQVVVPEGVYPEEMTDHDAHLSEKDEKQKQKCDQVAVPESSCQLKIYVKTMSDGVQRMSDHVMVNEICDETLQVDQLEIFDDLFQQPDSQMVKYDGLVSEKA